MEHLIKCEKMIVPPESEQPLVVISIAQYPNLLGDYVSSCYLEIFMKQLKMV